MQHQLARKDEAMFVARLDHVEVDRREAHLAQGGRVKLLGERREAGEERFFVWAR
jgi:hypothetical protein